MTSHESLPAIRAVILGSDTLMAARPATPIQLARACLRAGFDFVAPVSWGEELLATNILSAVRSSPPSAAIVAHCPFVVEALREAATTLPTCYFGVAPPVATARYLREAFKPRPVSITYAGRCPGAVAPDIDASVLPEVLLGQLLESGVSPDQQPGYFDELLPPDRSRYTSLPGGVPDPTLLMTDAGATLREAATATLSTVAGGMNGTDSVVIDLETSCGCVCARDRFAVAQLEPPRAAAPVVSASIAVSLIDDRVTRLADELTATSTLQPVVEATAMEGSDSQIEVAGVPLDVGGERPFDAEQQPELVSHGAALEVSDTAEAVVGEEPGRQRGLLMEQNGAVEHIEPVTVGGIAPAETRGAEQTVVEPDGIEAGDGQPKSPTESSVEGEADWFAELQSDVAAFPEPEPYHTAPEGSSDAEPMTFTPVFEESLFAGIVFQTDEDRSDAHAVDDVAAEPNEVETAIADGVQSREGPEFIVDRAVVVDGPESSGPQVSATLEPWARPPGAARRAPPLHVEFSRLGHADAIPPAVNPVAPGRERDADRQVLGPRVAPQHAEPAAAHSEAPVEVLSQGLRATGLADLASPAVPERDRPAEPSTVDARGGNQRIRHAVLVVALGGLALAGSVYAASLTGWFRAPSTGGDQDSNPPLLPAYEVTQPAEVVPPDTSVTSPDSARPDSDSTRPPRRPPRSAAPPSA
jgi:hypothetical protein